MIFICKKCRQLYKDEAGLKEDKISVEKIAEIKVIDDCEECREKKSILPIFEVFKPTTKYNELFDKEEKWKSTSAYFWTEKIKKNIDEHLNGTLPTKTIF